MKFVKHTLRIWGICLPCYVAGIAIAEHPGFNWWWIGGVALLVLGFNLAAAAVREAEQ